MWTKQWFFELMHKYDCGELTTEQVWDYVDLHSSASNDGKPIVSGSLPLAQSRCCGRCDGINDICVADMFCEAHGEQGCEDCFGKRQ